MKYFTLIVLCLSSLIARADHLLGSEITYTHISNKTYKVNITLYRNCNECKLGNDGGGAQTDKCSDLDRAFIRTISASCSDERVGTILLTKVGNYEDITEVCDKENSVCGTNPTYPYGIEAHYYEGTIDFDDYITYSGCEFHIYIDKTHRSNSINTLQTNNDRQYNFAAINPWIVNHSSPVFNTQPTFIYPLNQPVYEGQEMLYTDEDSIAYKLASPYKEHNVTIPYTNGFSPGQYLSVYCPSGDCTPNANNTPPIGLTFDSKTGNKVFTPTVASQQVVKVLEVEQWRKVNGIYHKLGVVRRDIQQDISTAVSNNTPRLATTGTLSYCIGQQVDDTIAIIDAPVTSGAVQDSTFITLSSDIPSLTIEAISISQAPYTAVRISGSLENSYAGEFGVYYHLKDNNCPAYGKSSGTFTIHIAEKPQAIITSEELFCGTQKLVLSQRTGITNYLSITRNGVDWVTDSAVNSVFTYQNLNPATEIITVKAVSDAQCADTTSISRANKGNTAIQKPEISNGASLACEGDSLHISLNEGSDIITGHKWTYRTAEYSTNAIHIEASSDPIYADYIITRNTIQCPLNDTFLLDIKSKPSVNFTKPEERCYTESIDLEQTYVVSPLSGSWSVGGNTITDQLDVASYIVNSNDSIAITYTYEDEYGCTAAITEHQVFKENPVLKLNSLSLCGTSTNLRLKNAIELPHNPILDNITWDIINKPASLLLDASTGTELDVATAGQGVYDIIGINELSNGCIARDTASITVTDGIKIELDSFNKLCQSDEIVNLSDHFEVNISGGGWSSDQMSNHVTLSEFIPKKCGQISLTYVYDRNNCFDEVTFTSEVVCKPEFSLTGDSICSSVPAINLAQGYQWTGTSVSNNTLDPSILSPSAYELNASQEIQGCVFDTSIVYEVLPPLEFNITKLPTQLCEGEVLQFNLTKPSYSLLSIQHCAGTERVSGVNLVTFKPTQCHLDANTIGLNLVVTTNFQCPSVSKAVNIPYHSSPKELKITPMDGCESYTLATTLQSEDITKYTLTGPSIEYSGSNAEIFAPKLPMGQYSLSVNQKNQYNCATEQQFQNILNVHATPSASFSFYNDPTVTLSDREITLNNFSTVSTGSFASQWSYTKDGNTTNFSTENNPLFELPSDTGTFQIRLIAHTPKQCADTTIQNVRVVPDIIAFIPNAFTPDNKGPESNSAFRVTSAHAAEFSIDIYNKWGQKVFATTNINEAWDGTFNGGFCQNGVYLYNVLIVNKAGEKFTFHGTVNLLR